MGHNSPTPLLINTDILSKLVGNILETLGAPSARKSACLNKVAALLAGSKHNWGYLTGLKAPFVAATLASDYSVQKVTEPGTVPAFVIEGARKALADASQFTQENIEKAASVLASFYLRDVPLALYVFETADEICNDLVHNRPKLLEMVDNEMRHLWVMDTPQEPTAIVVHLTDEQARAHTNRFMNSLPTPQSFRKIMLLTAQPLSDENIAKWMDELTSGKIHAIHPDDHELEFAVSELVEHMDRSGAYSRTITQFMIEHKDDIQAAFDSKAISPRAWQHVAELALRFETATQEGLDDVAQSCEKLIRHHAEASFGGDFTALLFVALDL